MFFSPKSTAIDLVPGLQERFPLSSQPASLCLKRQRSNWRYSKDAGSAGMASGPNENSKKQESQRAFDNLPNENTCNKISKGPLTTHTPTKKKEKKGVWPHTSTVGFLAKTDKTSVRSSLGELNLIGSLRPFEAGMSQYKATCLKQHTH